MKAEIEARIIKVIDIAILLCIGECAVGCSRFG